MKHTRRTVQTLIAHMPAAQVEPRSEPHTMPPDGWIVQQSAFSHGEHGELHIIGGGRTVAVVYFERNAPGHSKVAEANAELIAAAPDLLAALTDLLDQATGPVAVYGDGIGSDGKKTGLSHWEFNRRTEQRIATARAAIARATGK